MIERRVKLWLNGGPFVRIPVSQFDTMWQFVFTIIKDGLAWTIPTGATAVLNGLKPDGNVFAFSGTISGNTVTVDADVQMTACAGDTICELSIIADGKTVGTANFTLAVEAAPKSPDDVSSESTLPAYGELIEQTAELIDQAQEIIAQGPFLPSGGTPGQVLTKTATGTEWDDVSGLPDGGNNGQVLTKTSSGAAWSDAGTPTQAQTDSAVADWLDDHPEATTTVQDGSITEAKLASDVVAKLNSSGVTIDDSLSVQGAAADAKATGDAIDKIWDDITGAPPELAHGLVYVEGYYIDANGNVQSNQSSHYTDYLSVSPEKYSILINHKRAPADNIRIVGYDSNKNLVEVISTIQLTGINQFYREFTVPSGVAYIRISLPISTYATIDSLKGSSGTGIFDPTLSISGAAADAKATGDAINEICDYVGMDVDLFAADSIDDWEIGGVNAANGSLLDSTQRLRTKQFIRVTDGTEIYANGNEFIYCFYDSPSLDAFNSSKTTNAYRTSKYTHSNGNGYILVAIKSSVDITAEIKQSLFESATIKLNRKEITKQIEDGLITDFNTKKLPFLLVGQPYAYLSETIEDEILDSKTCDDVYAIYDDLCTNHPESFVRLSDIGAEATQNLPIRMYRMKWTTPFVTATEASWSQSNNIYDSSCDKYRYRHLFISSGTHGNEKSSVYGVALAIQEILDSDSEFAKYIRANFVIDIVPIVNPAGFNATTRNNGSGININRDFIDRTTPEAQAIYNVLTSNDYYACIDSHNSGGNANYVGITNTNPHRDEYIQAGMKFGQIVYNDWKILSADEQYATSPYMQFWLHSSQGMMQDLFTQLGLVGYLIESVGVFAQSAGTLTPNHKKYCKFTKDLLINSIIMLGTNEWN